MQEDDRRHVCYMGNSPKEAIPMDREEAANIPIEQARETVLLQHMRSAVSAVDLRKSGDD